MVDVSCMGARLDTSAALGPNTPIKFTVVLPDGETELVVNGRVIWMRWAVRESCKPAKDAWMVDVSAWGRPGRQGGAGAQHPRQITVVLPAARPNSLAGSSGCARFFPAGAAFTRASSSTASTGTWIGWPKRPPLTKTGIRIIFSSRGRFHQGIQFYGINWDLDRLAKMASVE